MQAILFVGIPASGKTTFYCQRFKNTHVRISLDLLKTRSRESRFLETCFETRQSFVVDNTNPTAEVRKRYIDLAQAAGYEIIGYYFQSQIEQAIERNSHRDVLEQVPIKGILGIYHKLENPSYAEGFDALYEVSITPDNRFRVERRENGI